MVVSTRRYLYIALFSLVIAFGIVAVVVYRVYNKEHQSALTAEALPVESTSLAFQFESGEQEANKKYFNKALKVSGIVKAVQKNQAGKTVVTLEGTSMTGVICTMDQLTATLVPGNPVTLTGFCSGYLADVVLDRCINN